MESIILGTLFLSVIHGLIPNHWMPLVSIAKAEKWSRRELLGVGLLTSSAHVLGTIILGVLLGLVGLKLSHTFEEYLHLIAPVLLIILGLIYFSINLPHHHHSGVEDIANYKKSKRRWIWIFTGLMFISPCLEVESLFLSAGGYGLDAVLLLSLVYAVGSIVSIVLWIDLAFRGTRLLINDFFEHNEKRITGIVLIVIGLITFFVH